MAEVQLATALEKQIWIKDYFKEYVRASRFGPYIKTGDDSIIVAKMELQEEAGKTINIPLITRLTGEGVSGSQVLDGNEESLGNYNCAISIDWRRNGVRVPKSTSYKTEIDLLNAGRAMLKQWEAEQLRTDIIYASEEVVTTGDTTVYYGGISVDSTNGGYRITAAESGGGTFTRNGVTYTSATEAQKDAYLVANSDRILFGASRSNASSNDFSTSLANIDNTSDKMTTATASLAKRMAMNADPHIRPFMLGDGREYFVMFTGPRSFRDLKLDTAMVNANRDARAREGSGMDKNPLFQDGDLIYDGIIFREVPEIPHVVGVGNGGIDVECNVLCGQQAIGIAWGQQPTPRTDNLKDYQFRPGVAIEELLKVKKLAFNSKQHGCVSVWTAAVGD